MSSRCKHETGKLSYACSVTLHDSDRFTCIKCKDHFCESHVIVDRDVISFLSNIQTPQPRDGVCYKCVLKELYGPEFMTGMEKFKHTVTEFIENQEIKNIMPILNTDELRNNLINNAMKLAMNRMVKYGEIILYMQEYAILLSCSHQMRNPYLWNRSDMFISVENVIPQVIDNIKNIFKEKYFIYGIHDNMDSFGLLLESISIIGLIMSGERINDKRKLLNKCDELTQYFYGISNDKIPIEHKRACAILVSANILNELYRNARRSLKS